MVRRFWKACAGKLLHQPCLTGTRTRVFNHVLSVRGCLGVGERILRSCLVDAGMVPLEAQHIRQFADINISTAILVELFEGGLPKSAHFTDDSAACMEKCSGCEHLGPVCQVSQCIYTSFITALYFLLRSRTEPAQT